MVFNLLDVTIVYFNITKAYDDHSYFCHLSSVKLYHLENVPIGLLVTFHQVLVKEKVRKKV